MSELTGPGTQGRRLPAVAHPALLAGAGVLVVIGAITVAALDGPGAGQPSAAHVAPPTPPAAPAPPPRAPDAPRAHEPQPTDVPMLFDRETVERALVGIERVLADERVAARVDDVRALGAQLTDEEELRVLVDLARERIAVAAEELPVAIGRFEQWLADRAATGQG
jgi:hypothetical protein